jgi:hypothetical protein
LICGKVVLPYEDGIEVQVYEVDKTCVPTIHAHNLIPSTFIFFHSKAIDGTLRNEVLDVDRRYAGFIHFIELNLFAIFI